MGQKHGHHLQRSVYLQTSDFEKIHPFNKPALLKIPFGEWEKISHSNVLDVWDGFVAMGTIFQLGLPCKEKPGSGKRGGRATAGQGARSPPDL